MSTLTLPERFTFFWSGPLSQWYPAHFTVPTFMGGRFIFNCAEQFMMVKKAETFRDFYTMIQIMNADHPRRQKELGRQVRGYDDDTWSQCSERIVEEGNFYKFSSNGDLLQHLLNTSGTSLVEASPYDKVWGVGLAESDPRIHDRSQWLGSNKLGFTLEKVRQRFETEEMFRNLNERR